MTPFKKYLEYSIPLSTQHSITVWQILLTVLIILVGFLLLRMVGRMLVNRMCAKKLNPNLIQLVQRTYLIVVIAVVVATTLQLLNVPLAAFAFISGAFAIGVGFGAQNIINNFISGWILMGERPIRIGDFLEVGGTKGTVEAINTRSTKIKRTDGVHLLIPNSQLLENTVVNWTLIDSLTRSQIRVGVAYGSPVKEVAALLQQALDEQDEILKEPAPSVIFEDFGDSSLVFDAYFWASATCDKDLRTIRSDLRFKIVELFCQNGITIAFPQRDVHIGGREPLEVKVSHSTNATIPNNNE